MSHIIVSDEDLVRQDNAIRRAFMEAVNRPKSFEERVIIEARERHQRALHEARERIRAKGIDPDTL